MLLLVGSLEELSLLCKIIQYQVAICTEFSLVGVCSHISLFFRFFRFSFPGTRSFQTPEAEKAICGNLPWILISKSIRYSRIEIRLLSSTDHISHRNLCYKTQSTFQLGKSSLCFTGVWMQSQSCKAYNESLVASKTLGFLSGHNGR